MSGSFRQYIWTQLNRQIKKKKILHRRRPGCLTLQQCDGQVPLLFSQHGKAGTGVRTVPGHQKGSRVQPQASRHPYSELAKVSNEMWNLVALVS